MNYCKLLIIFSILIFGFINTVNSQTVDELRNKISDRSYAITRLEEEISKYQTEIEALGQEKDSLSKTIKSLDITKKKLEVDTKITENKIGKKNLEITELSLQIGDKSERIDDGKRVITQSLYTISQMDASSMIEVILSRGSFTELWNNFDELIVLQKNIRSKIKELENLRTDLEYNKKKTETIKSELLSLNDDLKNQAKIISSTVKEKSLILDETKNTEANYNKLLASRKAQKEAYEKEVLEFESAIKIIIDPNSIPKPSKGVLSSPLDKVIYTQYFGNTKFASQNSQLYNGNGHGGIDYAASIGTNVKAALNGVILETGNTDIGNCRSYGKWVMIKHLNGLSTLYAHLSLITVSKGQIVATGESIGYSGNTGYSTGPHLHFGVYATEGLKITKNPGSKNCSNALIPYADLKAYLNPLSYL